MTRTKRLKRASASSLAPGDQESEEEFQEDLKIEIEERGPPKPGPASRSRAENLRERVRLFYGTSDAEMAAAIRIRSEWSDVLFSFEKNQLRLQASPDHSPIDQLLISQLVGTGHETLKNNGHSCVVDGYKLMPHETRTCENVAAILNTGFRITTLDWSPVGLLAVGIHTSEEAPMDASTLFDLKEADSLIYIYSVKGVLVTLVGTIEGSYGVVTYVEWRPSGKDLLVVFGNGCAGILTVGSDFSGENNLILKPLPNYCSSLVTSACWRTNDVLTLGYKDGHIVDVCCQNPQKPNFVIRAHSSLVTSLLSGWPGRPNTILTSGVDGWSNVYHDVADLRQVCRTPRLKFFANCACFSQYAESFVSLEDNDTTKLVPWRKPDLVQAQTALTRHNSGVSAVASSSSHPLIISGGQDGELQIANPVRRTMTTRRNRDAHLYCAVWRLECSHKTSEYRFVDILQSFSIQKRKLPSHLPVYPSAITITGLSWEPNSTWYAAGTVSGLIRIENISG